MNKLGPYITKLMSTVIDKDQEQFVINLAWSELRRLNFDMETFLRKHSDDGFPKETKTEKQLLQEEKNDTKK